MQDYIFFKNQKKQKGIKPNEAARVITLILQFTPRKKVSQIHEAPVRKVRFLIPYRNLNRTKEAHKKSLVHKPQPKKKTAAVAGAAHTEMPGFADFFRRLVRHSLIRAKNQFSLLANRGQIEVPTIPIKSLLESELATG